jgi:hypothetical protein
MGLFSIDRSNYEGLRQLCDKSEKAIIEYDKLEVETKTTKHGQKLISKARSAMDRGTLTGFKTDKYIVELVELCALWETGVTLLTESPEESKKRIDEIEAAKAEELQRNDNASKGDIWDSLDK